MNTATITVLIILGIAFTAYFLSEGIGAESKNHPPFEATTTMTPEMKQDLKKLVNEAEANYRAKNK